MWATRAPARAHTPTHTGSATNRPITLLKVGDNQVRGFFWAASGVADARSVSTSHHVEMRQCLRMRDEVRQSSLDFTDVDFIILRPQCCEIETSLYS